MSLKEREDVAEEPYFTNLIYPQPGKASSSAVPSQYNYPRRMMHSPRTTSLLIIIVATTLKLSSCFAFTTHSLPKLTPTVRVTSSSRLLGVLDDMQSFTSEQIAKPDRQWNFNNGRAPWGFKDNAEVWNGRVAQVAFVWVLLQEVRSVVGGCRWSGSSLSSSYTPAVSFSLARSILGNFWERSRSGTPGESV